MLPSERKPELAQHVVVISVTGLWSFIAQLHVHTVDYVHFAGYVVTAQGQI